MSAIYKEPLSVLKRLLFVAMVVLGMTVGIGAVDAAGIVSGKVYNDTNNDGSYTSLSDFAVSGVTVELQPYNGGAAIKTTTTNATGDFQFTGVTTPGNYRVIVKADTSYGPVTFDDFSLTLNQDKTGAILLVKGLGGSISGSIFMDTNRNGTLDSGENTGYASSDNMKVHLRLGSTNTSPIISSVYMSKTDGSYSFKNLPSGVAYTVTLDADDVGMKGYGAVTSSDSTSIAKPVSYIKIASVTSGITGKNIGITEVNGDGVGGFVVIDQNGDNAYVMGEDAPLIGATVALYYDDETTPVPDVDYTLAISGATGAYQIKDIPLWKYKVKVTPPAGNIPTGVSPPTEVVSGKPAFLALDMSKVEPHSSRNFYMKGDPADTTKTGISGFVFGYDSAGWIKTPGPDGGGAGNNGPVGTKFSDITVDLYNASNTKLYTQKTKTDGSYGFSGLAAGVYTVKITQAETTAKYNTYVFMNDSDGKSATPKTLHPNTTGGVRTPYQITANLAAGTPQTQRNFWFGKKNLGHFQVRTVMNHANNSWYWSSTINGWNVSGGSAAATYTLIQEDGTRAVNQDGSAVTDVAYAGRGVFIDSKTFSSNLVPGIYRMAASNYETSLTNTNSETYYYTNTTATDNYQFVTFSAKNSIKGTLYVDQGGTKKLMQYALVNIYRLKTDGSDDYEVSRMGTGSDGKYWFANLPDGKYRVAETNLTRLIGDYGDQVQFLSDRDDPTSGTQSGTPKSFVVTLTSGTAITDGDIVYESKNTSFKISGKAYLDLHGPGSWQPVLDVYGTGDIPFAGVTVELFAADGITPIKNNGVNVVATTNANGDFTMIGSYLVAGTYVIKASKAGTQVRNIATYAPGATRTITLTSTSDISVGENFLFYGPGAFTGFRSFDWAGCGVSGKS